MARVVKGWSGHVGKGVNRVASSKSDRRCVSKSRPSSIGLDGGQRPPPPWYFSGAEAKAIRLMEELCPLTPGRLSGNGLLHDGSPNAQRVDYLLCAVLHPLGDSPGEPGRIHAVPGSGVDGAAGAKHDSRCLIVPR